MNTPSISSIASTEISPSLEVINRLNAKRPLKNYLIIDKALVDDFFISVDDNDFKEKLIENFEPTSTYFITKTELQFKRNSSFLNGELFSLGIIDNNAEYEVALIESDKVKMQQFLMKKYLPSQHSNSSPSP